MTRHAEVVAISGAQKSLLGTVSLDDCSIYVSAEPCAVCSMMIRESRIGRVVYALRSPHMGGVSKWPVLTDEDISESVPEVFAPPPEIIAGFMAEEAEQALLTWNPFIWGLVKARGLFVTGPLAMVGPTRSGKSLKEKVLIILRKAVFDRFGRRREKPSQPVAKSASAD